MSSDNTNLPNLNAVDIEASLKTEQGTPEATVVADAGLDDANELEAVVAKAKEDPKTEGTLFDPGASIPKPPIAPGDTPRGSTSNTTSGVRSARPARPPPSGGR